MGVGGVVLLKTIKYGVANHLINILQRNYPIRLIHNGLVESVSSVCLIK